MSHFLDKHIEKPVDIGLTKKHLVDLVRMVYYNNVTGELYDIYSTYSSTGVTELMGSDVNNFKDYLQNKGIKVKT